MMQDVRARRCEELADPVTALMVAVVTCNERSPESFTEVIRAAIAVRDVAERGSAGIDNVDYVEWASGAPGNLTAMIDAAEAKNSRDVWSAFSHPQHGLHRVASACSGLPRWQAPEDAS